MNHSQQPLWVPSAARIAGSHLARFQRALETQTAQSFDDYAALHRWSVAQPARFWLAVWDYTGVVASTPADTALTDAERFPGAQWFPGARLNYAENLLSRAQDGVALIGCMENGSRRTVSWAELRTQVASCAAALRELGVGQGDRVAAMLPNVPETVVAMLATASLGAVWSSCSPDFGVDGVLDRFGQISPTVLIACDGYYYNGKTLDCTAKAQEIAAGLPGLAAQVQVPVIDAPLVGAAQSWSALLAAHTGAPLSFVALPFDHPLFIMYSSGTTGVPKCIVHGAGGTLLQHLKEHQLHVGLAPGDVFFYYTTCGWMMWNWLVSGLASGATLLLYDGSPFKPGPSALFSLAEREQVAVFGVGAKYLAAVEKAGVKPRESSDLPALRTVLSTGSPLSHESFRFVYRDIKTDVCLASISGGTDIISCFALGNECLPVYEGELQCPGLGMAVEIWNDDGAPVLEAKGELVCTQPFPSAPIGFWNDPEGARYRAAYFERFSGVWAHGDYGEITANGGVVIHGRSDAILNPGGVRIGTAEIYRQVEKVDAVLDSVCIGQRWADDVRVLLFVVLREGLVLDDALEAQIRATIRRDTTPRHVPAKIVAVADIPRTRSGKIAELAVRKIVEGEPVNNTEALANPESLALFKDLPQLQA